MTVRTRFAPSPTGLLHIGGARTALFNYLFARHHGGEFLLRIEDTDRERSTEAATRVILEGLDWLGLTPDQPPVFQSTRMARHAEVARQMLASGHAYHCYCTAEELRQMREQAVAEGRSPRYDGRWRDRDPAEAPPGVAPSIRLKAPRDGETVVEDLVQGTVRVANAELDDMIILRSDGTPTYNHSVVVDDHDMGDHPRDPRRRPPDQHVPPGADLPGDGLGAAALRAYPADPRRGRREAVEAARRGVGAGVPRAGLSARGAVQLPAAPRLGAWRRRGDRPRRGDPAVRPRRRRPGAEPDGLRQAAPT